MRIIIDAQGGDNAPREIVHGAIQAAEAYGVDITLVGRGDEILEAMREIGADTLPAGVYARLRYGQCIGRGGAVEAGSPHG